MPRGPLALIVLLALPATARGADLLAESTRAAAAAEAEVGRLLAHALAGDAVALAADVAALAAHDRERRAAGRPPTGLTDDARYLAAALAPGRDARRAALEAVLDADPDRVVRRLAEHRLDADDVTIAGRLLTDDRYNRRVHLLNDAVRPLGLFSGTAILAALNPLLLAPSALDSIVTTSINLWHYDHLSTPEREALGRYRTSIARERRTRDAPDIVHAVRRLGEKREAALCAETVTAGTRALEAGNLDRAGFYLESARQRTACAAEAAGPLADLRTARARRAAEEEAGCRPVDDPPFAASEAEAGDYEALLVATAVGEPGRMIEAASRLRTRHPDSAHADSARYVIAAARHLTGDREAGREALEELADDGDSSVARHAAAVVASRDYDRLGALGQAERDHARSVLRYVFFGGGMDGRTALYGAANLASGGLQGAQTLGIVNAIGIITRGWKAWRRDPASNEEIIARGEELLAREPSAAEARHVHARLADAYERSGAYARALMHYRESEDPDREHVAELEKKLAEQLLQVATRDGSDRTVLEGIARQFPETPAGEEATRQLRERAPGGETVLGRDLLRRQPDLLGPDALDLEPTLLDGEADNGELADAGVALADGTLRLTLRDAGDGGERTEIRQVPPARYARARAAASEALYASRLVTPPPAPDEGRFERWVPFYLQGSVGKGGVSVTPGLKMRRYRSAEEKLYQ